MTRSRAALASAVVVAVMLAVGVWQVRPPAPAGESTPADAFSASRAISHIEALAGEPRPVGSSAHDRARDHVVEALTASGFATSVHAATVIADGHDRLLVSVDNVVGRLAGRDRTLPVVLLVAHYDGVAAGPGAADNASGVAVVLEAARALAAGERPPGDVVILVTDGEEVGLAGARAFLQDPAAPVVGAMLNVDNAGSSGPSVMYQTSVGNSGLVAAFAETARPLGSSLIDELARRGRVQSDFTPLREAGIPTMTFGLSEGFVRNHTALDTADRIAPGSIQQQGEQVLSAARAVGTRVAAGELAGESSDVVYFPVSRRTLVVYGRAWVVPVTGVAAALYAAVLAFGLLRRDLDLFSVVSGAVNSLLTLVFMGAVTAALWGFGWAGADGGDASNPPYASDLLHRGGLTMILVGVGVALYLWGLDRDHTIEAALGAALWWLVLAFYVAFALPGGSYLLAWPLVAVLVSLAVVLAGRWRWPGKDRVSWPAAIALWAGLLPALVLFGSSIYLLYTVDSMRLVLVLLSSWLLLGALLPELALLGRRARRAVPAVIGAAGLLIVVGLSPATGLAEDPSRPLQAVYRYDAATATGQLGEYLPGRSDLGTVRDLLWSETGVGAAGAPAVPSPRVEVVGDRREGDRRTVRLRLVPAATDEPAVLSLFVESDVGQLQATVGDLTPGGGNTRWRDMSTSRWHLDWFAPRRGGTIVELTVDAGRALALRVAQLDRGLPDAPELAAAARPAGAGPPGVADATVIQTTYVLGPRVGAPLVEGALPGEE